MHGYGNEGVISTHHNYYCVLRESILIKTNSIIDTKWDIHNKKIIVNPAFRVQCLYSECIKIQYTRIVSG